MASPDDIKFDLVSVECGKWDGDPAGNTPAYIVHFSVPKFGMDMRINIRQMSVIDISNVIVLARHYMAKRLRGMADHTGQFVLSEDELTRIKRP
ncbi:hypothetical protein [Komagataeibacter europaeus]|uniref:hypothetical protein n=1 Tax=Komagataeibacter europaeus TaxID=33995 RepID=UPI0012DFD08F|nr:hypothetical protein [Komagataeibacter europaeus]